MSSVVAVVGSYRRDGVIQQAVEAVLAGARSRGATTQKIDLLDHSIDFCRNCRICTQPESPGRVHCNQSDGLEYILDAIDTADAVVFASPVNFFNVTAITQRFLERLVVYAYWPFGTAAPKPRIQKKDKRALIVVSSAAPALLTRFFTGAAKSLKTAASLVGARTIGAFYCGLAAQQPDQRLSTSKLDRAHQLGAQLVSSK